ncbi:MAG: RnfABCDGE type electron transport complex subunit D, partial [Gammaproteobacteria bacterium]
MSMKVLVAAPYTHAKASVRRVMGLVLLALVPATGYGLIQFGWPAVFLFVVTVVGAIVAEVLCLLIAGKAIKAFLLDGSAILSGWLLAMTLPPWAPWWIGVLGAMFAIVIGKHVFGGLGQNLFNPAMVARVALLIAFPLEMTLFTAPTPLYSPHTPGFAESLSITFHFGGTAQSAVDANTGATLLGHVKTELSRGIGVRESLTGTYSHTRQALGNSAGSLGETSAVLILLGGLFLLFTGIITWQIPVALLAGLALPATVFYFIDPERYLDPVSHLLSGAAILGAFFIATDMVTSPVSSRGQLV